MSDNQGGTEEVPQRKKSVRFGGDLHDDGGTPFPIATHFREVFGARKGISLRENGIWLAGRFGKNQILTTGACLTTTAGEGQRHDIVVPG